MFSHPSAWPLHDAALAGDVLRLQEILDGGENVNTTNEYRSTALLYAAKANQMEAAALLIRHGARVDASNNARTTALHCAASSGHLLMCKFLIDKGADLRKQDEDTDTALDVAKEEGQQDVCAYLEAVHMALAEGELREAMASDDVRTITLAVDRAEDEEVVGSRLISAAKDRLSLRTPRAAAESRAAEELAEVRRALAAAEMAAEAVAATSTRRMLLAATAGALLVVGLVVVSGIRRRNW